MTLAQILAYYNIQLMPGSMQNTVLQQLVYVRMCVYYFEGSQTRLN